jgi:copper resistance protein D
LVLDVIAAVVKAVLYSSSLSAAGFALAIASLRWTDEIERRAVRLMRWSAGAVILAAAAWVALLIFRLGGESAPELLPVVLDSGVGAGAALQIGGAFLLLTAAGDDAFSRMWRGASALILTSAFAFSGHAATVGPHASVLALVHTTAAAWWIGCLWMLRHACAAGRAHELSNLVLRFSSRALVVVGGLVLAGVLLIVVLVDITEPGWFDEYERLLVLKVGLAIVALSIALFNKVRLTPRLGADAAGPRALQRSISMELAAIGAVLIATAILTTFASPYE